MSFTVANADDPFNTPSNGDGGSTNETKMAAEKYFRNLLKKVTHGESVEENTFKIIHTESDLRAAYCNLYNKNNDTEGGLDKRDKRIISEMRKVNTKLMKIEDRLSEIEKNVTEMIRLEMRAIRDELIRSMRNISGKGDVV